MVSLARKTGLKPQEETEVDITPMLDVVFIMLIFFIVTASFVKESGLNLNKPPLTEKRDVPNSSIVVEISANDEIRIQNRLVQTAAIKSTMVRMLAETPEAKVSVRLHPHTTTKAMVGVIDGIRSASYLLPSVSMSKT